jgi:hypothetical protein
MGRLRTAGLQVHQVDDMLPGNITDESRYEISRYDNHPNALANDLIAEYVVREILGKE